jgi:hypothetical protein
MAGKNKGTGAMMTTLWLVVTTILRGMMTTITMTTTLD